jgi:hypothetical protein
MSYSPCQLKKYGPESPPSTRWLSAGTVPEDLASLGGREQQHEPLVGAGVELLEPSQVLVELVPSAQAMAKLDLHPDDPSPGRIDHEFEIDPPHVSADWPLHPHGHWALQRAVADPCLRHM